MDGVRTAVRDLMKAGRPIRAAILVVFLLSVAVRVILVARADPQLVSDAFDYHAYARSLLDGNGYASEHKNREATIGRAAYEGFTFRAYRAPGYPVFLAGLYGVFGWHPRVALAANVVADLLTQLCFLLIAWRLLGPRAAVFVQILLAAHVLWTPSLMTESFYTALLAGIALMLVFDVPQRSFKGALLCGVVTAAALFTRPITICVFPVLLWKFVAGGVSRRQAARFLVVIAPAVLLLAAWGARNYRLFGQVVLMTTNLGPHNAYAFGIDKDRTFLALRQRGLNEAQINDAFLHLEWRIARENPLGLTRLWVSRLGELFSLRPACEVEAILWTRTFRPGPQADLISRAYRASYYQYYVTYALAAVGACLLAVRRQRLGGLWLLMIFYVFLHAAISRGDIRLCAPLYPMMCLIAAGCAMKKRMKDEG
jgi:hypothetical protein